MSSTPRWYLRSTGLLPLLRKGCASVDSFTANNAGYRAAGGPNSSMT